MRAARLWGADCCRFSVGGSTHGNQALALARRRPGRRGGRSAGRCTGRCCSAWCSPGCARSGCGRTSTPARACRCGVAPAARRGGARRHPDARAVFLGDPSYVGTVGDVAGLADAAHAHGVPLVVDAAWARALRLPPGLPPHALAAGADAMVTSAHKTLPAFTPGRARARAHRAARPGPARRRRSRRRTRRAPRARSWPASTPPRALLERDGEELLGAGARRGTRGPAPGSREVDGLRACSTGRGSTRPSSSSLLAGTGADGIAVEADLHRRRAPGRDGRPGHPRRRVTLADDAATARRAHRRARRRPSSATAATRGRSSRPRPGPSSRTRRSAPGGVLRDRKPVRADGRRRTGQRRARRALPARDPGPGPGRGDHGGRARTRCGGTRTRGPDRLRRRPHPEHATRGPQGGRVTAG